MSTQGPARRAWDPRPARTRHAILDSITRLGEAGGEITVGSIVAEAGVSRSSFYAQFADVGDVAVQLIRQVYDEIEPLDRSARDAGEGREATVATTGLLIAEIEQHRGLYKAVLGANISSEATRAVRAIMADGAVPAMRSSAPAHVDPEVAAHFVAAGVFATLTDWLRDEEPVSTGDLQAQLLALLPAWVVADGDSRTEPVPPQASAPVTSPTEGESK